MTCLQDLKKYYFYYWFAFPALCPEDTVVAEEAVSIETCFNSKQMSTLQSRWAKLPTSSGKILCMDGRRLVCYKIKVII